MQEQQAQSARSRPDTDLDPAPSPPAHRRWGWGTRLAVVACASWLGFVVLHRILSGRTYWWGPLELEPPLLLAVVPVVLAGLALLARPIRWRLSLVPLLALVLSAQYTGINLASLWHTPPPAPADALTVVSWNTMYWDQDLIRDGELTTADFYEFLQDLDADVYLLQEYAHTDFDHPDIYAQVQVIDHLPELAEAFPEHEVAVVGRNITLSRFPITQAYGLDSTPWLPRDMREVPPAQQSHPEFYNVQTIRADIRVMGRTMSFYNPHLYHPPSQPFSLEPWPGMSAREVYRFTDAMRHAGYTAIRSDIEENPHPVVLAGDLNTSPAMGILRELPDHLVDHTRALSSLYPTSWSVGGPNEEREISIELWRLDWLFTTADIAVHRYELRDPADLSDHRVQFVELSVAD
ncbi:endonuclease/exonuclease/phosphatase family protein [Natronosporangium hydrolyticum]|uniref:Endonuclease/exonuclease/phosphatase family protein n=1 Tax=Natronosporangium hydrolyticum TaxID=2811111 RepID=A0A895Y9A3_9ACTN|nr:endonuclease/exonuclease/phosphatase family protein [Natronosporangium hydrolyticum]QSB12895.1 endonuclease/exonuclease/phosphatase family protein [Natronosporangium hydrolyticum]